MSDKFERDPNSVLDWQFDWSGWLAASETISSATVTVSAGITKDSQSNTTTTVTVWLSGGTANNTYSATCRVTTNQGRTDDRTIYLVTKER